MIVEALFFLGGVIVGFYFGIFVGFAYGCIGVNDD